MPKQPRVLLVDADSDRTSAVRERLSQSGLEPIVQSAQELDDLPASDAAVMIVAPDADMQSVERVEKIVTRLAKQNTATVVWGSRNQSNPLGSPLLDCLSTDITLDEVVGRLSAMARYAPMLKRMDRELKHLQLLGQQLNRYFNEIDQEMQLAGRLQRDFLPRELPCVGAYRSHALYRPASWVSGDTYDISPIDDRHVGLFLGDAMGHGVAAGLITMFMQQTLTSNELRDERRQIYNPPAVLTRMHESLVRQQLPSCQFVTAVYGVLDTEDHCIRASRAGHPYPLWIAADGTIREVTSEGGLLGVPDIEPDFDEIYVRLEPGEKFVVYTDGLEDVFVDDTGSDGSAVFSTRLKNWAALPAAKFIDAMHEHLDQSEGSLNPADDATVVAIERMSA